MNKRPLSVTIIGFVYIAVGAIGIAYHFSELKAEYAFRYDGLWIELIRLLAVVSGVYLLLGHNWARWLALVWIGFHVILSAFHDLSQLAIHCLFFAVIAWSLFRPAAKGYFLARSTE
jgi:hypothetical protein